jgi:hypothetical protein
LQEKFKREFKAKADCKTLRKLCCKNDMSRDDEDMALTPYPTATARGENGTVDQAEQAGTKTTNIGVDVVDCHQELDSRVDMV